MIRRFFFIFSITTVVSFSGYLLYQKMYISPAVQESDLGQADFNEEEFVSLLNIKERSVTGRKKEFNKLSRSLRVWFEEEDKIFVREESLLPSPFTLVFLTYDRDDNSFENESNISLVSELPYQSQRSNTLLNILKIDRDGTIYLEFRQKTIKIPPNKSYNDFWFENFQLRNINVKNKGLFQKNKFEIFEL